MPIFDGNLPYTNLHELNLDWIADEIKQERERLREIEEYLDEVEQQYTDIQAEIPDMEKLISVITVNEPDISIAGKVYSTGGFVGNLNGTAAHAQHAINADRASVAAVAENDESDISMLRKLTYNRYKIFESPVTLNSWFDPLTIYQSNDKQNYRYYLDVDALKNAGGSTIYVDRSYTGTSDGTQSKPYKKIKDAMQNASSGDTIKVAKGIYRKNDLPIPGQIPMDFSMNIICDEGTILTNSDALTWTQDISYPNVYYATRSNVDSVIDVRNRDKGYYAELTQVASKQDCVDTLGSWFLENNTTLYVNIGEAVTNDKIVAPLTVGFVCFDLAPTSRDMRFYLENAICINSENPIFKVSSTSSYDLEFIAKNCKFLFGKSATYDGLSLLGTKSVLVDCEASFNMKDGFNYHSTGGKVCYGIEINCVGNSNGLGGTSPYTYNGSTAHDGSQIIRLHGTYINNKGSNVADVNTSTVTLNFGCYAFDSDAGTENIYDSDFCVQQTGATMYLYSCFAVGNSYRNLWNISGGTMYESNCIYGSSEGTITEI